MDYHSDILEHLRILTKYFLLTYLVSWSCFIGSALLIKGNQSLSFESFEIQALLLLGTITPSLIAIWLTMRESIPGQTIKLLERITKWEVNIRWYLFAAGFMVVLKLLVAVLYKSIMGVWPQFGKEAWYLMLVAILFSTWVQAGEEIGWRGFALPRMAKKMGLPFATIILGVIWACWHLPLFFVRGTSTFGQSFPFYLTQVTAFSVILGWLYWRTKGSLLLVMLMHAAVNNTKDIVPSAVPGASTPFAMSTSLVAWLTATLLWIFAIYCLIQMRMIRNLE